MKKRLITLAMVALFVLAMVPFGGALAVETERLDLDPAEMTVQVGGWQPNQLGWASWEGHFTQTEIARAVSLNFEIGAEDELDGPQLISRLITADPGAGADYAAISEHNAEDAWRAIEAHTLEDGVLTFEIPLEWTWLEFSAIGLQNGGGGPNALDISAAWLEVVPAEVVDIDVSLLKAIGGATENQLGFSSLDGAFTFEQIQLADTLNLRVSEAPQGGIALIVRTGDEAEETDDLNWDEFGGFGEHSYADGVISIFIPNAMVWEEFSAIGIGYWGADGHNALDLGITEAWLELNPIRPTDGEVAGPPELAPAGSLPFQMSIGSPYVWGDPVNQIGWSGEQRTPRPPAEEYERAIPYGLTHGLLREANWFVIYVDNAPSDEIDEFFQLMIFGHASWEWEDNNVPYPIMQVFNAEAGRIELPIAGHPYMGHITDDDIENRSFGIMFQYAGGIENLGIQSVWLYDQLPGADEPPPPPTDEPDDEPDDTEEPEDTEDPAEAGGVPVWAWVLIAVGGVAVVVIIIVVAKKKGK